MMKKRTRILPLVLSVLLLLVFVTARPRARSNPNPTPPVPGGIAATIRWKRDMGLIPIGPGKILASNSACSAFFIYVVSENKVIAHSSGSTSGEPYYSPAGGGKPGTDEYYYCTYFFQVPEGKAVRVVPGMGDVPGIGDVDLLPELSRQSYYWTDPWIGGTNSRPPAGWRRGFKPADFEKVSTEEHQFEMIYVRDSDPKPSSTSERGASPLLPALNFAGAWRAKFGESSLELILQQAGKQVTGELRGFAYRVVVREGRVVGNTLRFQIRRVDPTKVLGNPNFEEPMGTGELVMDEGEKSFTGTLLGTATSGTLVGR